MASSKRVIVVASESSLYPQHIYRRHQMHFLWILVVQRKKCDHSTYIILGRQNWAQKSKQQRRHLHHCNVLEICLSFQQCIFRISLFMQGQHSRKASKRFHRNSFVQLATRDKYNLWQASSVILGSGPLSGGQKSTGPPDQNPRSPLVSQLEQKTFGAFPTKSQSGVALTWSR